MTNTPAPVPASAPRASPGDAGALPDVPAAIAAFAGRLADAARPVVRRWFRTNPAIVDKSDATPVTEADREIERALRALIAESYPDHGMLGEEYGPERAGADWVWVLDPIDGTRSFISGRPTFGTLIALCHRGRPILGVIDHGALDERWLAARGHGCRFNGAAVTVSGCATLAQARFSTTSPEMLPGDLPARLDAATRMVTYGGDCYQYGLVASGHLDLVIECDMQTYDFCALEPVVREAGGVITDWNGGPLTLASDGSVLAAASPAVATEARAILATVVR